MFLACLVKPQCLRGVRDANPAAERDNGGKAICRETGPAHISAASRGLGDRELKLEANKYDLRRVIRNVNSSSHKEIADKVSINLNKDLDFCKSGFDC